MTNCVGGPVDNGKRVLPGCGVTLAQCVTGNCCGQCIFENGKESDGNSNTGAASRRGT